MHFKRVLIGCLTAYVMGLIGFWLLEFAEQLLWGASFMPIGEYMLVSAIFGGALAIGVTAIVLLIAALLAWIECTAFAYWAPLSIFLALSPALAEARSFEALAILLGVALYFGAAFWIGAFGTAGRVRMEFARSGN